MGVWYRARSELRRRWRAKLVLVLIVGLAGGAVLTTIAGARRSSTAYERFRAVTRASDLDVAFEEPPTGDLATTEAALRSLPQVAAIAHADFPFVVPAGSGAYPYLDFLAQASTTGVDEGDIDLPRIIAGRLPDPRRDDEVALVDSYAREAGLSVGDRAEFESFAPEQLEPLFTTGDAGPPAGPRFSFVVTAILDAPTFLSDSSGDFVPRMFLTPAFVETHGEDVATYPGGFTLRFHNGAADTEAVSRQLRAMFPDTALELAPADEIDRKIARSIDVIVTALLLCALAAGVAGTIAIAQALARHVALDAEDDLALAALGMTRSARVGAHVASALPVAALGAAVAVVVAVVGSVLMPVGVARRAEPDLGVTADWAVLGLGAVAIVVAVVVVSVVASAWSIRRARVAADTGARAPSRWMVGIRRSGLPTTMTTGVGLALEPRGGTGWAVRSALLGAVVGLLGVTAVVVFIGSVDTLVRTPASYGSPFDAVVSGFSGDPLADGGDDLLANPEIARAALGLGGLGRIGEAEFNTHAIEPLKGDLSLTMLEGRAPHAPGEVVLGRATLERAHVDIGDEVAVEGARDTLVGTVVGTAVFPVFDERSAPGRGALLVRDDFERISAPEEINADVLIDWTDSVDADRASAELAEATETEVFAPRLPSDVNNLRELGALPRFLAGFLALLAALAVAHGLVTTARVRRRDFAVLRTLGFERRQLGAALSWQATTLGIIGSAIGVPLGLVAGRLVWRWVTEGVGVADRPATPGIVIALVVAASLVVVNVAAILAGRSTRNVSAAVDLRAS